MGPVRPAILAKASFNQQAAGTIRKILFLSLALLFFTWGHPELAEAQSPPADVIEAPPGSHNLRPLPDLPEGFRTDHRGGVEWAYPQSARRVVRDLQDGFPEQWEAITEQLGGEFDDSMVIRIARDPEEMAALAPMGLPPPEYAVGVAYPYRGLILLTLSSPGSWERPQLDIILAHELSHIALRRATRGASLPRWFVEGVAIHQARERSIPRLQALWAATYYDELIPLRRLDRSFPAHTHEVNLAYAQSADVVGFLTDRGFGGRRFRRLMRRLRAGDPFEEALQRAFYLSLPQLEREWKADAEERFQSLPIILGGGGIWIFAVLLSFLAWFKSRDRKKKKLEAWAKEEAALDRIARILRAALRRDGNSDDDDFPDPDLPVLVSDLPPEGREDGVPTVDVRGNEHTLH